LVDYKGFFICCSGATKWFAAPGCTEATGGWNSRNDAVTNANSCMGSCGWFVPSVGQLQNPGNSCRTYWDAGGGYRWSNTENNANCAFAVYMGSGYTFSGLNKVVSRPIRAFRTV